MESDRRLIEDFVPIKAISTEASREKSIRKGHVSTLHLWWARRPLVACRAAIYAALVPASEFVPKNGPEDKRVSLGRANATKFLTQLCKYPGDPRIAAEARRHILEAQAERVSRETGRQVTVPDIEAGRAPRPLVLDMFAGGGAIPLEALRLGCDAYALDLNPVAYLIELCTLVYPQEYGRPDARAKGSRPDGTWGGLAYEVRHWGEEVLRRVKNELDDLYPRATTAESKENGSIGAGSLLDRRVPPATRASAPIAYLWTRTVICKNPVCGAEVPLARHTWLCRTKRRCVGLRRITTRDDRRVGFEVVEASSPEGLAFDPGAGSRGGSATCPFCGTVADSQYVKDVAGRSGLGKQPMAMMCQGSRRSGRRYLPLDDDGRWTGLVRQRLAQLIARSGLQLPTEPLEANPRSFDVQRYAFARWCDVFTERQNLLHLTIAHHLRTAWFEIDACVDDAERREALKTCVALTFSRLVTQHNAFAFIHSGRQTIEGPWGDGKFPMSWDFAEANPFSEATGSYANALDWACNVYATIDAWQIPSRAHVSRGSATSLPHADGTFDAIITDPPYYDSVSYSNLSDAFYVWLKRSLGDVHPEHFASRLTPKRNEAIKATYRHAGDERASILRYEELLTAALREAHRALKANGIVVVIYAHKTTMGWVTLVDALRASGFTITEAWPIATEAKGGRKKVDRAMLASSIFLVARKRGLDRSGRYAEEVRPQLHLIVRERVGALWSQGISGAELLIACVGAGLRAFTRFGRVEYANGDEVAAEQFLGEVETFVLEAILDRLSKEARAPGRTTLAGVDARTRCYVLWRYTYRTAVTGAGEAVILANGTHVELDGPGSLTSGPRPLIEKRKGRYRLRDYAERGDDDRLGLPGHDGQPAPVIDALHRTLWLMENHPSALPEFLRKAQPNREQMRLVAHVLGGPVLKGGVLPDVSPMRELMAVAKLISNWQSVVEDAAMTSWEREEKRTGQKRLDLWGGQQ